MSAAPLGSAGSRISPGAHPDPFGPSDPDGWPGQGTVLRYRDRGGVPDEISPAPQDTGFRPAGPAAAFTGHRPPRSRPPSRRVVLAVAAVVAVLGAVAGLVIARSPWRPAAAPRPGPAASRPDPAAAYTFPAQRYGSGLVVARRWTLSGPDGALLTETVTLSSATGTTLSTWFKDSIPAAVVHGMQTLRFSVIPKKVVYSDPVVQWYLQVPAHGTVTVGYVATVPPQGSTTARLAGWAQGLDAIEMRLNTPPAPRPSPSTAAPPPAGASSGNGGGNPNPYPTYTCDPTVVTCNPNTSPSPSGGNGGF